MPVFFITAKILSMAEQQMVSIDTLIKSELKRERQKLLKKMASPELGIIVALSYLSPNAYHNFYSIKKSVRVLDMVFDIQTDGRKSVDVIFHMRSDRPSSHEECMTLPLDKFVASHCITGIRKIPTAGQMKALEFYKRINKVEKRERSKTV